MKQQYLVLGSKNDKLKDLIGLSYNQRTKFEAIKILQEIHKEFYPGMGKAVVTCIDPNSKEILGIGGSSLLQDKKTGRIFSDLISDNFGEYFAPFFRPAANLDVDAILQDDANVARTIRIWRQAGIQYNRVIGTRLQVGQGISAPARIDFGIETPFTNGGVEDTIISVVGTSAYTSATGKITAISANFSPTAGTGTVTETVMFSVWRDTGDVTHNFLLAHDAISPGVQFLAAKSIVVDYEWQL